MRSGWACVSRRCGNPATSWVLASTTSTTSGLPGNPTPTTTPTSTTCKGFTCNDRSQCCGGRLCPCPACPPHRRHHQRRRDVDAVLRPALRGTRHHPGRHRFLVFGVVRLPCRTSVFVHLGH